MGCTYYYYYIYIYKSTYEVVHIYPILAIEIVPGIPNSKVGGRYYSI